MRVSRIFAGLFSARVAFQATLLAAVFLRANESLADPQGDYTQQIKTTLKARCYACHGALKQEANLRLDTLAAMLKGGDNGAVVKAGDVAGSLILARVTHTDAAERMPPEGEPLTPQQIAQLKAWIEAGAKGPADEEPETDPRQHWAFLKPKRPVLEFTADSIAAGRSGTPLDLLIAREQSRRGLVPLGPAEKHTLLRRVTVDLTGLPPTREELHGFLADESADAYERVVDRLLANPSYGERWGRHWMDVWRYSDWYGRRSVPDVMNSYPQIWRWRDWIVRSLNEDKPYSRMVAEMLAADEVCPEDEECLPATGFIVRNWFKWNYDQWMKDQTEHTAKAFLGLTLNCALCHDHKYDPISQEEYFRFRAHFEPLELRHDRVAGEPDPSNFKKYVYAESYGPISSGRIRIFDEKLDAQTFMYRGGDQRNKFADKPPVPPGVPSVLGGEYVVQPIQLPPRAYYPGLREFVQREELSKRTAAISTARAELETARQTLAQAIPGLDESIARASASLKETLEKVSLAEPAIAALEGKQSLVLSATEGRRALAHKVSDFQTVDDHSVVTFLVQILDDGHVNFQFASDMTQGATGGWVGFEAGKILSYKPGGFVQIEVGQYDLAKGESRFHIQLEMLPSQEQMKLTVKTLEDSQILVDQVPVTLKGWAGPRQEKQGIFLDARPGTAAMFDEFEFRQAEGRVWQRIDFESPAFSEGSDVAGTAGWLATSFCVAPATSLVGRPLSSTPEVRAKEAELIAARQARLGAEIGMVAAQQKIAGTQADLTALEARILADNARYGLSAGNADELSLAAARAEREANLLLAQANQSAAEVGLSQAMSKPSSDAKREAEIQAAQQKLNAARAALVATEVASKKTDATYSPLSSIFPQQSSGRRTALAQWLTSRDNPLAARVAVNHIWQRHFGRGIVETPANFGRNGKLPTNQPLIDWLASELMDGGWDMKRVQRQIVTSDAFRRRSQVGRTDHPALSADPENRFLWRYTPARMEAETLRDSVLFVSQELEQWRGGKEIDQSQGLTSHRRSLYFAHHGEARMEFLELFDVAVPSDCYQRTASVRPQQALALTNSELTLAQSRRLAAALWTTQADEMESEKEGKFIAAAFEQVLGRTPTGAEQAASRMFLTSQRELAKSQPDPAARARESLVHALFNHNDFVTVR